MTLTDERATEILGPKCPDCGWRRGQHRPPVAFSGEQWLSPCPRWTDLTVDTAEESA